MAFVDRMTLFVRGGKGGAGCCSFRREKYVPKGGPDGGDGGDGGSVIVRALAGADSLAGLAQRKHWRADNGGAGTGSNCHGRSAATATVATCCAISPKPVRKSRSPRAGAAAGATRRSLPPPTKPPARSNP